MSGTCTIDCDEAADGGGCIACGPCNTQALSVSGGTAHEVSWQGLQYTFESFQGCQCHRAHVAPAGRYRVTIPVWDSPFDPTQGQIPPPSRQVEVDFELAGSGTVVVNIGPPGS